LNKRINILLFLSIVLLFNTQLFAQKTLIYNGVQESFPVTDNVVAFIDSSGKYTCSQIIKKYNQGLFALKINDLPDYTDYTYWIALNIDNQLKEDIYLVVKPVYIHYVNCYKTIDNSVVDSIITGKLVKNSLSDKNIYGFNFKINSGQFLYFLKINSKSFFPINLEILDGAQIIEKTNNINLYNGLIIGALLLTFLYHFIIWIFVRNRLYIYYLLYIFFVIFLFLRLFSFDKALGIQHLSNYLIIFNSLLFISSILFVREFFLEEPSFKKHSKIIIGFIIFGGFCIFIDLLGFSNLSINLLIFYANFLHVYIFILSVLLLKKNSISSILFSISWLIILLSFIYGNIIHFKLFGIKQFSFDLILYARFTNIVLLSLVIGNRLNVYSIREKRAKTKELKAIRERDFLIAKQQEKLKQIVAERNRKILEKIEELSGQQEELKSQTEEIQRKNHEINRLNKELEIKTKEIELQNQILQKNKEKLEIIVNKRKKELQNEKERAEVANKLKTSFLNNLSNEVKAPLNAINDFSTLLAYKKMDKTERDKYLHSIINNIQLLLALIEDVVTLSRLQAGVVKIKKDEIKLNDFFQYLVETYNDKIKETEKKKLKIKLNIPENKDITIIHDYDKLWQVFNQLMSNSLKFTNEGFIEIGFEIRERKKDFALVRFFVKDTGSGMSNELISTFLSNSQNKNYSKKGLGLAIVKEYINLFEGNIHVKSEKNNGTIIYFEFESILMNENLLGYV